MYVTPPGAPDWCEQRLQGLKAAYDNARTPLDIRTVTVAPVPPSWERQVDRAVAKLEQGLAHVTGADSERQKEAPSAMLAGREGA